MPPRTGATHEAPLRNRGCQRKKGAAGKTKAKTKTKPKPLIKHIPKRNSNNNRHTHHKRNSEVRHLKIDIPAINKPADPGTQRADPDQCGQHVQQRGRRFPARLFFFW
ncbi:hypothetical protein PSAB6_220083 [Paraburkholderia sabiae]|nr:hypothetical protein PSAB6_220083 [Paraburkholderia sabiae]